MNIQNIPLTPQVPADLGFATLDQALADSGLTGSAFADSLMAELSKLTQAINASTLTPEELAAGQTVQEFAGLPGNQLPLGSLAEAPESEINLEETLSALKEVLEHIQAATAMTEKSEALIEASDLNQVLDETDAEPYNLAGPLLEVTPQMNPVLNNPELPALRQMIDAAPVKTETEAPVLTGNLKLSSADAATAEDKAAAETKTGLSAEATDKKMSDSDGAGNEKTVPKSPIDTAHLHRQFSIDNKTPNILKTDVPAMSKNFADPEWSSELGDRIVWMNNRSLSAAELNLNPQHLGPVRIRIDMNQDQATITFSAQHASVREALEAAIPRLREMMSGQQLNLADVTVSQQSQDDQGRSAGFGQMMQGGDKDPSNLYGETDSRPEQAEGGLDLTEALNQGRASASQGLLSIFA
ncbi:flagellar hook-length control protein FliK [Methylicorpusculum sp.]|uniref:flagellar hook-length control protein FliK n=1 Tax=Methylicorpusculum sp. TaxID=2713644 RepID=UPI00272FFB72|nr:flagellar hook-length control protein FliK [Methylicorpusculum sp.]MDP2180560.1 flagellar hook-length control protein FliK [Methylicorpusculum sp.]MDP3527720.1 flagellar hook-length control protein FliK [Methylicorpusculum sp.]MDZ4154379.1 flagellar hook-length control protein FliK [Methylicorpusculum sp.]